MLLWVCIGPDKHNIKTLKVMSEENKNEDLKVEQSTGEAKKAADQEKSKAKKAKDKKPEKQKDVKVRILCHNAAGKYGLPQHRGMTVILKENQANEIVGNKDGELVK